MSKSEFLKENSESFSGKKLALNVAKLALSIFAFYLIYLKIDTDIVARYFKQLNVLYFLIAIGCFFISKLISAYRLNAYYHTQNIHIPQTTNAKVYFNAMFYNIFIPLIGGEAFKVFWIKKNYEAPVKPLVWSALLDRGNGLVALIILSVIFFNSYDQQFDWGIYSWLLIPLSLLGSWLVHKLFFSKFLPAFNYTTLLSLAVQVFQVFTIYFVILSLGITDQIMAYIFVFLISSFAYVLPFLGARELAFVYGAEYLGLDNDLSLVISVLFYGALAINSLAGGVFFFFPIQKK